jgi:peptidoglycan/LPS O-acetylase OafA/YrhL
VTAGAGLADSRRLAFIIWMKAVGMLLIVFGHVAAWAPGAKIPPINTKQLGVAFFVFISGFTLARDRRPAREIIARRLFEVWLFAFGLAVVVSLAALVVIGDAQESNYLPLLGGINVLFDHFPANPTTWYVGTYIHLIVIGVWLQRRFQPGWKAFVLVVAAETAIRAALFLRGLEYVPYMLLTNWMSAYLAGWLAGAGRLPRWPAAIVAAIAVLATLAIHSAVTPGFPFWTATDSSLGMTLAVSGAATALYVGCAVIAYAIFGTLDEWVPSAMQLIADHTLLIFLAHMPIVYALRPWLSDLIGSPVWTSGLLFVICTLVPAAASAALHHMVDIERLRQRLLSIVGVTPPAPAASAS